MRARRDFDALWATAAPFVAPDLRESARKQFQPVFWELYLAAALQHCGVRLVDRAERGLQAAGPDLLQREPAVYYEAVAVTPGVGADAVREPVPVPGKAQDVPDAAISLRLASGLREKVMRYTSYRNDGVIPADAPCVIAINAGAVPGATGESSLPRIVRTVLPFGHEVLHFDWSRRQCVGRSFEHRAALMKRSGASVPTSFFDQPTVACISAVLYSAVDPFNCPATPGEDFVLVHNPQAAIPLTHGQVPASCEFWVEDDRLHLNTKRRGAG